ncbi:MAG: YncE family protein [bacterium]
MSSAPRPHPLELMDEIPLPGVQGRIDHFTMELKPGQLADQARIIFSALGNNTVEVVNAFASTVAHTITGLEEPQGMVYVPDFNKLFVANAGDGTVKIYDGTSYKLLKSVALGEDADDVRYDAVAKRVYVGYGSGAAGAIAVIDARTGDHLPEDYNVGGDHPEGFEVEAGGDRIFVNVPGAGNIVSVIDRKTHAITKWHLHGAAENFPMALDEADHRLFIGTRNPPEIVVLDTNSGEQVAAVPAVGEMDDLYYDASLQRIYGIGAAGYISVIQQTDPGHYHVIANIPTRIGVRTGILVSQKQYGDRFYVAVPALPDREAALWVYVTQNN